MLYEVMHPKTPGSPLDAKVPRWPATLCFFQGTVSVSLTDTLQNLLSGNNLVLPVSIFNIRHVFDKADGEILVECQCRKVFVV